jgi:RNA polymerase primary sigma factor
MNAIKIKSKEQSNALNAWHKAGYCGSIIAGTGFGKSRCGVLGVAHAIKNGGRALVLVPTTQLQEQFAEEFKKWGHTALLTRVEILCYQSAHKLENNHYEIVVCDEVHLGLSPVYRQFFKKNTYDKLLCMTATPPEEEEYRDILKELAPTVYTITIDQCVQMGLVAPYDIYCIPITLTDVERQAYKKANNLFVQCKYKLGGYDAFAEANRILRGGPGDKGAAAQFFNAIRQRKAVVQHAENKLHVSKQIADHHAGEKILTFSGTNEFTNAMGAELNGLVYHSGKSQKQREKILQEFKDSEGSVLCSTKALNQGFDVPDVGIGIIAGLESKSLPMIQRVGRLIRFKENKRGRVYILYVQDSQEEKWMDQATKSLNNVQRDIDLTQILKSNV